MDGTFRSDHYSHSLYIDLQGGMRPLAGAGIGNPALKTMLVWE